MGGACAVSSVRACRRVTGTLTFQILRWGEAGREGCGRGGEGHVHTERERAAGGGGSPIPIHTRPQYFLSPPAVCDSTLTYASATSQMSALCVLPYDCPCAVWCHWCGVEGGALSVAMPQRPRRAV